MSNYIELAVEDGEIYAQRFSIKGDLFKDHTIQLYVECQRNKYAQGAEDFYFLDIYFTVDGYGAREHAIGVEFGHEGMTREQIDREIFGFVQSEVEDSFNDLIYHYLKKEKLFENWMESNYS